MSSRSLVLALGLAAGATTAPAFPEMIRHEYGNGNACHFLK